MARYLSAVCPKCVYRFLVGQPITSGQATETHPASVADLKCPFCECVFQKLASDLEVIDFTPPKSRAGH